MPPAMTSEQIIRFIDVVQHPERYLSPEENAYHDECVRSIIEARRAGERVAHEMWIR